MDFYQAHGKFAEDLTDPVLISGRYIFQKEKQNRIVFDVRKKLKIKKTNTLLEIGCNIGFILTPLSYYVKEAVGIDHPSCLKYYQTVGVPENITLISGRWPNVNPGRMFDKILVYSVMHYIENAEMARIFIDECLKYLSPNGLLMLGDIPNIDAKERFINSDYGKNFHKRFLKTKVKLNQDVESIHQQSIISNTKKISNYLDDKFIIDLLADMRLRNFGSYVVPQMDDLPFSKTREDILIWKH